MASNGPHHLYCDGGARGNPGPAGAGALIKDAEGNILEEITRYLGERTNNYAEYAGLYLVLKAALKRGISRVKVHTDSELMAFQVSGRWKVKHPTLKKAKSEVDKLVSQFEEFSIHHIRREHNTEADALANKAIDDHLEDSASFL